MKIFALAVVLAGSVQAGIAQNLTDLEYGPGFSSGDSAFVETREALTAATAASDSLGAMQAHYFLGG